MKGAAKVLVSCVEEKTQGSNVQRLRRQCARRCVGITQVRLIMLDMCSCGANSCVLTLSLLFYPTDHRSAHEDSDVETTYRNFPSSALTPPLSCSAGWRAKCLLRATSARFSTLEPDMMVQFDSIPTIWAERGESLIFRKISVSAFGARAV